MLDCPICKVAHIKMILEIPEKGGFFTLPKEKVCHHPEHDPPMHLVIPQGKGYRHICPGCGFTQDIIPPQTTAYSPKTG
jgi:hypothetical protein